MILPIMLLPFYKKDYIISLSPDMVRDKLINLTQGGRFFFRDTSKNKPFRGKIKDSSFKIYKKISIGYPFKTIICGKIISENGNTKIKILIRIDYVFLSFFILVFLLPIIGMALYSIQENSVKEPISILPVLIFFYLLIVIIPFNIFAHISFKILNVALGLKK